MFILLAEEHSARVDLSEMIMKDLHKSIHFEHQLSKETEWSVKIKRESGLGMKHSFFL
jgi:hypothetical protein